MDFKEIIRKGILVGLILFGVSAVIAVILAFQFSKDLPPISVIEEYRPPATTQVIARDGSILARFYVERREPVPLTRVPEVVRAAFISNEDKRFYRHHGIDPLRILKALMVDIIHMRRAQGASTITQQLARNMFLTLEKRFDRKIKEMLLAFRLERVFSKDEILERYLNQIYFGHGVYGIQAASHFFFGKDVSELNAAEAAMLAGIPKNPRLYSPLRNPEAARRRQRLILRLMHKNGYLDDQAYKEALETPVTVLQPHEWEPTQGIAPYFLDMVRGYLLKKYGEQFLYKGGAQIYTTLDPDLQRIAEQVVDSVLTALEDRWGLHPSYQEVKEQEVQDTVERRTTPYLQAALVALDPQTGEILALVGGRDYRDSKFNRAVQAHRQPGSAFKPFVYTAALESGYTPISTVFDIPVALRDPNQERSWFPENFDHQYLGPIPLRKALALSRNLATVNLALEIGPRLIAEYAHRLGITSPVPPYPSIALGSPSVTLLEMVRAYATFANYGIRTRPYYIRKIMDLEGTTVEANRPVRERVLDDVTAYIMTNLLESVVNEGTGRGIRAYYGIRFPVAGKTGTTNEYRDAWFIGYTSNLVVGVWVGYDSLRTISDGATGARMAIPIWATFVKEVYQKWPIPGDFRIPPGVDFETICVESGLLATPYCPKTRREVFREGTEPTEMCNLHGPGVPQDSLFWQEEKRFLKQTPIP